MSARLYSALVEAGRHCVYVSDAVLLAIAADSEAMTCEARSIERNTSDRMAVCVDDNGSMEVYFDGEWKLAHVESWRDRANPIPQFLEAA